MSTEIEIEKLVRERASDRAAVAIRAWLRQRREGEEEEEDALLRACDWYRRLDLLPEAYRLLGLRRSVRASPRRLLWGAWLMNLMGATHWARDLLGRANPTDTEQFRLAGDILYTSFELEAAIGMYERMLRSDPAPESYRSRVASLSYADALAAAGRFEEAGQFVRNVLQRSPEPLLQAIGTQAIGEYLAQSGRYPEAVATLERAHRALPAGENGNDRAFLEKWLGYALVRAGRRRKGLTMLRRSVELLERPGRREEAWLQARRLLAEVTAADEGEWARLRAYPGIPEGLLQRLPGPRRYAFGAENPVLEIRPVADEFTHRGKSRLGLTLELRLLAMLVQAGDRGLSRLRAKCLLWPRELHSLGQLDNRLSQVIFRLERGYGIRPKASGGMIRAPRDRVDREVRVEIDELDARPGFLRGRDEFQGRDVDEYYAMSRTERFKVLARWRALGWIRREPAASRGGYIVAKPESVRDF